MKKTTLFISAVLTAIMLSGCQFTDNLFNDVEEVFKGLNGTIQTYDENSNIIDQVQGKSIAFKANSNFVKVDDSGSTSGGSVLDITVGGKQIIHVGSTLIFYEKGVENVFESYAKKVDIQNFDRGVPFINKMVNDMKSTFVGHNQVILIRSQSGIPLATFTGDSISVHATDVEKMTKITIDGKRMYIYRADYTIYDLDLLK